MRRVLLEKNILELIRRTATDLPRDVELAIRRRLKAEPVRSRAAWVLKTMLENARVARRNGVPLCQDTGALLFYFRVPVGYDTNALTACTRGAVSRATRQGYLRENTFDVLSGRPFETNVADAAPVLHFQQGARRGVDVRLVLKGGGSENVGRQYALPNAELGAERDLEGVRRCVLDAIWQAQGLGCAPGVVGVCVGGDRGSGYECSKEQFLRRLSDRSPVRALATLERRVCREANRLGVGPMGLGGETTVLGVKVGTLSRLPASYFVTVSFMCWAFRRRGVQLGPEGGVQRWLY